VGGHGAELKHSTVAYSRLTSTLLRSMRLALDMGDEGLPRIVLHWLVYSIQPSTPSASKVARPSSPRKYEWDHHVPEGL
jgi:hypothetical protein